MTITLGLYLYYTTVTVDLIQYDYSWICVQYGINYKCAQIYWNDCMQNYETYQRPMVGVVVCPNVDDKNMLNDEISDINYFSGLTTYPTKNIYLSI